MTLVEGWGIRGCSVGSLFSFHHKGTSARLINYEWLRLAWITTINWSFPCFIPGTEMTSRSLGTNESTIWLVEGGSTPVFFLAHLIGRTIIKKACFDFLKVRAWTNGRGKAGQIRASDRLESIATRSPLPGFIYKWFLVHGLNGCGWTVLGVLMRMMWW